MPDDDDLMAVPAPRLVHSESWLDAVGPAFERALLREGKSPATVRIYRWALAKLFGFLRTNDVDDLADLSRDHLERWQDQLLADPKMSARSRQSASSAARSLIRWAADREILDYSLERAIVAVRVVKRKRRPIPAEDLQRILSWIVPRRPHMSLVELRDRALFVYLLVTGARVNEVLQAQRSDYVAPIVTQKGGNEKQLRTTPIALDLIQDYLRARHDESPWLWIKHGNNLNATGDRLEDSGVREAWIRLCLALQIPRFTTHQLRHTAATFMASSHVSPFAIKERLGHAKLETTMGYIEVDEAQQQDADNAFEQLLKSPARPLPRAPRRSWRDYRGG